MKTRKAIYLGLATLLALSSLSAPMTVLAAGTDTSSSSSQSSSTGSSSSTSSVLSSSSSSASTDSSSASQDTKTTKVASQDSTDPVGTPSDATAASKSGWSFILTVLRKGFNSKIPDQYIAFQNIAKAKISGVKILTPLNLPAQKYDVDIYRWHWDETNKKWVRDAAKSVKAEGFLFSEILGFLTTNNYKLSDLTVGTYYYQYHYSYNVLFTKHEFFSNLSKVVVTPEPIPATSADTDTDNSDGTPKVIYSDVDYEANAILTPNNSTDDTEWLVGSSNDKLTFSPSDTRSTKIMAGDGHTNQLTSKYIPDSYYTGKVNTDPKAPGILANYKIAVGTLAQKAKKLYVGGLPAYNAESDAGGTWLVGGLSDLQTASQANSKWHYTWKFTDSSGKAIAAPTAADGVTNVEGDVDNIASLNSAAPLTFTKDSSFMKNAAIATAANKSYRAQVTFTTNLVDDDGTTQPISVVSNKAELQSTPVLPRLSLDEVPSFDFGDITTTDIYNGTSDKLVAKESQLAVTDTSGGKTWSLSAKMSRFTSDQGNQLENNVKIHDTGADIGVGLVLVDNGVMNAVSNSYGGGSYSSKVNGKLQMSSNHKLQIMDNEKYSSTITWDLSGGTPPIDPA